MLKDQIKESGDKFNQYQEDVESRKMEIQLLETEITNIMNVVEKEKLVSSKVKDEKSRMEK